MAFPSIKALKLSTMQRNWLIAVVVVLFLTIALLVWQGPNWLKTSLTPPTSEQCGPVPPDQQTCSPDNDCDDDGVKNPAVAGGDDCDDSNSCVPGGCPLALCGNGTCEGNETTANCPSDCPVTATHLACQNNQCVEVTGAGQDACSTDNDCAATPPPSNVCPNGSQPWDNNGVSWCVKGGTLSDATCQDPQSGSMYQQWGVINDSNDTYTVVFNGFFDETASCQPTTTGPSGGLTIQNGSIAPGESKTVRINYSGDRHDCGRVQLDACLKNERTGECQDLNGSFALGTVINYGTTCTAPTPTTHKACQNNQCKNVAGAGEDECTTNTDCAAPQPTTHKACQYNQCVIVQGAGTDQCASNTDCAPAPQTHKACQNNQCVVVQGVGTDQCSIDANCIIPPDNTHLECRNSQCVKIDGVGTNQCDTDNDCAVIATTHSECQNNQCVKVNGTGVNECLTNLDCMPVADNTHLECRNNQCTKVDGIGENLCNSDTDCAAPVTHTECQNNQCVSIAGAGQNQCASLADCATPTPQLTIGKTVRIGTGPEQESVQASPAATVEFVVTVASTGRATATAVVLKDALPQGLSYVPNSTTVNGNDVADGLITSNGISLGDIPTGQSVIVRFRATVAQENFFNPGITTLTNTATTSATNIGPLSDTASVTVQITPATHLECQNNQCVSVSGSGTSQCSTNSDCAAPVGLTCTPATQTVNVNQLAALQASGTNRTYTWSAPNGTPTNGNGNSFQTRYNKTGTYVVAVTAAGVSTPATCTITVRSSGGGGGGGGSSTHTECQNNQCVAVAGSGTNQCVTNTDCAPTVVTTPGISIIKLVRIVNGDSEQDNVTAQPGNTVEFVLQVRSTGTATATNVHVQDTLPAGLTYVANSTKVDGRTVADGIVSGGIALGDMVPGKTIEIRFQAKVAEAGFFAIGTTVLVNTAVATAQGLPSVNDTAFVTINRAAPPAPSTQAVLSIKKLGRNITNGQTGENVAVTVVGNDLVEFTLRVRNTSTITATGIVVRDILPVTMTYLVGSTTLNGTAVGDDLVSPSGLNIGTLTPNQEAVIRFQARVNTAGQLPGGTTATVNTAKASGTNTGGTTTTQLPVTIKNPVAQTLHPAAPSASDTGPNTLAIILMTLSSLLAVGYSARTWNKARR